MNGRYRAPKEVRVAGTATICFHIDFHAESLAALDNYLADLSRMVQGRGTTARIQRGIGIRKIEFEVLHGIGPHPTR